MRIDKSSRNSASETWTFVVALRGVTTAQKLLCEYDIKRRCHRLTSWHSQRLKLGSHSHWNGDWTGDWTGICVYVLTGIQPGFQSGARLEWRLEWEMGRVFTFRLESKLDSGLNRIFHPSLESNI